MSDASDDAEIAKLERAAEFMRAVRAEQQAGGAKAQTGGNFLSVEQKQAISAATENSALIAAVKQSAKADLPVNHLIERFEEMCRRQGMNVDADLRPSVAKLLAAELWINHQSLGAGTPAKKLVSATLHQGAIAPELLKEFSDVPRSLVSRAMVCHPWRVEHVLHTAIEQSEALSKEPEFQDLARRNPSQFLETALHFPSNPRERLRKIEAEQKSKGHPPRGL